MSLSVILDPPEVATNRTQLDLNSGPIRVGPGGIDWGDAAIQAFMAEAGRLGSAPVDYIIPNRQITIPLGVFTDEVGGTTFAEAKTQLQQKVARFQEEGGWLKRVVNQAPRLWQPTDLPGLLGWYKSDAITGVTSGGSMGSGWVDSSGLGRTMAAQGATPATYITNVINGLPIVRFGGASYFTTANVLSINFPVTVMVVLKPTSGTNREANFSPNVRFGNALLAGIYGGTQLSGAARSTTAFACSTYIYNGASSVIRQNGAQTAAGTAGTGALGAYMGIGDEGNGVQFFIGDIAEVIFVRGALAGSDLTNLEAYASARYALGFGGTQGTVVVSAPVFADVVNATLHVPDQWGEGAGIEPDVQLVLEAQPDFYGPRIYLDTLTSTNGEIATTLKSGGVAAVIQGDHPGRLRLTCTDTSGKDQRGIVGGFRSRNYDAAATAHLIYEAEALTPVGGSVATLTGASGGSAMRITALPTNIWQPVLTTDVAASGPMTHQGTYRVLARAYTTVGDATTPPVNVRLAWAVGATSAVTINDQYALPGANNFYIADLGPVALQGAPIGTHYWRGTIQALGLADGEDIWIDKVWLIPIDEYSFQLSAPLMSVQGQNPLTNWDNFSSLASAAVLNARVAPLGGAWTTVAAGAGGSTTDFAGDGSGHVTRSTNSDGTSGSLAQGRVATAATVFTDTEVGGDFMCSYFPHATAGALQPGIVARYTDLNNFLMFGYYWGSAGPIMRIVFVSAGVLTSLASVAVVELANTWLTVTLRVLANGQVVGTVSLQGSKSPIYTLKASHAALATGGALASGKAGMIDSHTGTATTIRSYDNAYARNAASAIRDAVVFGSRVAEIRFDGNYRLDSAGAVGSPVSKSLYDMARMPTSGMEARSVELVLKQTEGDFVSLPDAALDNFTVLPSYRPSYLMPQ